MASSDQLAAGRAARDAWRAFLHHIGKSAPAPRRVIGVRVPRKHRRILTAGEMQAILDGCDRLRDRHKHIIGRALIAGRRV